MKKIRKFVFILTLTIVKRVIAVLDFPKDIDDFISYANTIHESMGNSATFGPLAAKLAILLGNITTLQETETATKTKPPTKTVAERNAVLVITENNLRGLRNDVQAIADADVTNAEVIIISAGMKVKKQGEINKEDFRAENGEISETVKLIAKGVRGRSAHDWHRRVEGGDWVSLTPTLQATTIDTGLTKGTTIEYRHRTILKDGPTDWSQTVTIVIT